MRLPLGAYSALLVDYLRPQRGRALLLGALLLSGLAIDLLNPQILRGFIDAATAGADAASLARAGLLFFGLALASGAMNIAATYLGESVGWTATNALRADLARHCLGLDLAFHKRHRSGELIERIDGDINALAKFFSQFVVRLLGSLLLVLGVLALLWREDWRAGLALTLFVAGAGAGVFRARAFAVPAWAAVRQAQAAFYGFLGEQLAGTEDVRANGATGYVMRRFTDLTRTWFPAEARGATANGVIMGASYAVITVGSAVAFAVGAWLWSTGDATLGTVYLIFHYTEMLRRPIEQVRTQVEELQKAGAGIVRVRQLFSTRPAVADGPGASLPAGALGVEFRGVGFAYEVDEPVLADVSFRLRPGATLGLIGRTGSGKSTLANLLLRFYDPTAGDICLGGIPLATPTLAQLRGRIGFVTQEVQVFHATVRDNLTFFDSSVPDARLLAALADIGLEPWLRGLPAGLDTELAGAAGLSAGEAQLLAFARVLLRDPGLVLLDEASSRLDPATEALVSRAVDRLLAGRTGVVIAHRLATLDRVDDILLLDGGRVAEHGPRAVLAADPASRYAALRRAGLAEVLA